MIYQSKDFWDKFYIKFIESVTYYRNIQINVDEVEDWIVDGEYLNPNEADLFGDYTRKMITLLEEFQSLVLKGKELQINGVNWPLISIEELQQLYSKIDSLEKFSNLFTNYDNEDDFQNIYTRVSTETQDMEELYQFCVEWAHFYIELQLKETIGDFSFEFFWLILQAPFIFKGFGVLLFHDDFEINSLIDFTRKIIETCGKVDKLEWDNLIEFIEFCRVLETMSENWLFKSNLKY